MRLRINGIDIYYSIEGPDGAPWVTFSNSHATTHRMWDLQIESFTKRYRVLRYDQRGHGATDATPGPYSFELLVDDLLGLLDRLRISQTHFVGLSMGGMTGMSMALRGLPVLRTLVLCDTASRDPLGNAMSWQERFDSLTVTGSMEPLVPLAVERFLTAKTANSRPHIAQAVRDMVRCTSIEGYIGCGQAIAHFAVTDRLSEIAIPTMVVVGAEDLPTPVAMAKALHDLIAGSEFVTLNGAAHLSNLDQPDAFNEAVLAFLDRH